MRKTIGLLMAIVCFAACNNNNDATKSRTKTEYPIEDNFPPSGEKMSSSEKEAKLEMLIGESKRTVDSINVAYKTIRQSSRSGQLTMDERNQVSEALLDLSNTRDLILLGMQASVIHDLQEKTAALQTVMKEMTTKSAQMLQIAGTLTRVSGLIEKTTNLLSSALSMGVIRPRLAPVNPGS